MSRVTFETYCQRRSRLGVAWRQTPRRFAKLTAAQQWDLHDYYRFTETFSAAELHRHWRNSHVAYSSLPQRAGRAYKLFMRPEAREAEIAVRAETTRIGSQHSRRGSEGRSFRVDGLVRAEIDKEKLAKVLLALAKEELREQRKGGAG